LPIRRKTIQKVSRVVNPAKVEHRLQVLENNFPFFPVVGYSEGLREGTNERRIAKELA